MRALLLGAAALGLVASASPAVEAQVVCGNCEETADREVRQAERQAAKEAKREAREAAKEAKREARQARRNDP